jgi:hypothetical protein
MRKCLNALAPNILDHDLVNPKSNGDESKNLTSCSKSANKPSTSCVRTACPKLSTSLDQAVNNL